MTRTEILTGLREILGEVLNENKSNITEETELKEITGLDSLTYIIFLSAVEESFSMKFVLEESLKMESIGDIVETIERAIK